MIALIIKAGEMRRAGKAANARAKKLVAQAAWLRRQARLYHKQARRWERINAGLQTRRGLAA